MLMQTIIAGVSSSMADQKPESANDVWPGKSSGIIARLWAGIEARIPLGHEDETGFHFGTAKAWG